MYVVLPQIVPHFVISSFPPFRGLGGEFMKFVCSIRLDLDDAGNRYIVLTDESGLEVRDSLCAEWQDVDLWRIWYALLHDSIL